MEGQATEEQELQLEHLISKQPSLIPEEAQQEDPQQVSAFETVQEPVQEEGVAKQLSDGKPPRGQSKHSPPVAAKSSLARFASFGGADETLLQRVKHKTDELRVLFDLPEGESLIDDYNCALYKKILLQGRLYLFQSYMCFYSSLLGYTKKKVIPLDKVANIHKRRNYGFPNSIEVTWGPHNKREFFTSFLSRDDAYKKMLCAWDHKCPMARLVNEHVGAVVARQTEKRAGQVEGGLSLRASADGLPNWVSRKLSRRIRGASSWHDTGRNAMSQDEDGASDDGDHDVASSIDGHLGFTRGMHSPPSPDDGSDSDDEAPAAGRPDAQKGVREMEGPPPPRSKDMTRIMHTRLPISPRAFLQRFLSDDSHFFQRFHAGRGDKHITLSHWAMLAMGCVREMQFVSPLKYRIGPPEARCHQTQRYCLYEGDQLVFETSQVIPEIPYGDHFSVETRWDVVPTPDDPDSCELTCHVHVPFSKSTLLMPAIRKGALDSTRDAFKDLVAQMQEELHAPPGLRNSDTPTPTMVDNDSSGIVTPGDASSNPTPHKEQESSSLIPLPVRGGGGEEVQSRAGHQQPHMSMPSHQHHDHQHDHQHRTPPWTPVTKSLQSFLVDRNNLIMLAVMFWGLCVLYMQLMILRVASKPPTVVVHAGGVDVSALQRELAELRVQVAGLIAARR